MLFRLLLAGTVAATALFSTLNTPPTGPATAPQTEQIAPYHARFGRLRPVVAVVGENSGTELTDFVIPYGVLAQSGAVEMVAVATQPGLLTMRPALKLQPEATIQQFDTFFPDGADYVVVPAVVKSADPTLLAWITAQAGKGSTIVSICDGVLVVANTGLLTGHRATGHWATESLRKEKYPATTWLPNTRYVADGKFISSAGISAAMPVSLALVEAIAGTEQAAALARRLGLADWSPRHNSEVFHPHFGVNLRALVAVNFTNGWFHARQTIGVPVAPGVDEIALALAMDAYSRTGRSRAYALAATSAPLPTRHGLRLVPDRLLSDSKALSRMLPALGPEPSAQMLDQALAGISALYGRTTAYGVALDFEYPGF
ncbi:DJ-1/PfpI family protein [Hymenobacter segetis]|uniref:DJ-1/PfpI family protein n=1 Tax=Hymenobacter segetis TaxID=2025509 RepID=A0ABU9LVH1_9BACT